MISYDKKFVFVHIPKTGGTSIRHALTPYCDGLNATTRLTNKISRRLAGRSIFRSLDLELPLDGHASALDYKNFMGDEVFRDYFKFAIVRNPFDLHVSNYEYIRQNNKHKLHTSITKMSFLEYTHWRMHNNTKLQLDFVSDNRKCIIVDFIGKFENLDNDFTEFTRIIGISERLPFLNSSKHENWRTYYNSETINIVRKTFSEDFEFFGYSKSF